MQILKLHRRSGDHEPVYVFVDHITSIEQTFGVQHEEDGAYVQSGTNNVMVLEQAVDIIDAILPNQNNERKFVTTVEQS